MDNVIRLSKFVKNLGIVTTVLFLIIVLVIGFIFLLIGLRSFL